MFNVDEFAKRSGLEPSEIEFTLLVGLATQAWADVEDQLLALFTWTLAADEDRVVVVAGGLGESVLLKGAGGLVRTAFEEMARGRRAGRGGRRRPQVAEWTRLETSIQALIGARNELLRSAGDARRSTDASLRSAIRTITLSEGTTAHILKASDIDRAQKGAAGRRETDNAQVAALHRHLAAVKRVAQSLAAFRQTLVGLPSGRAVTATHPTSSSTLRLLARRKAQP